MIDSIAFTRFLGIDKQLTLSPQPHLTNHLGSLHAGALFTLAETASGLFLATAFPEYKKDVLPLLRHSEIKYIRPANETVEAVCQLDTVEKDRFIKQLTQKRKATVNITVTLQTKEKSPVAKAHFRWFITLKRDEDR
jgi:thioesterase domain-containing protein